MPLEQRDGPLSTLAKSVFPRNQRRKIAVLVSLIYRVMIRRVIGLAGPKHVASVSRFGIGNLRSVTKYRDRY